MTFTAATLDLRNSTIVFRADSKDAFDREKAALDDEANWTILYNGIPKPKAIVGVYLKPTTRAVWIYFKSGTFPPDDVRDIKDGSVKVLFNKGGVSANVTTGEGLEPIAPRSLGSCFKWTGVKDKKKAEIDIAGGWQAAVSAKPLYNWSVKAGCPFFESAKYGEVGPSFNAEASQQGNADPDSMKAVLSWKRARLFRGPFRGEADLLAYEFERAVKKEPVLDDSGKPIDQKFLEKNSNLMSSGKLKYVNYKTPLNFTLGGGFEAGRAQTRTVKKASRSAEDQGVSRVLFQASADYVFFPGSQPFLTFHGEHTTRLPFIPEPFKKSDVNGGAMYLTNKPRHWTSLEFLFGIRNGLGIVIAYKRGSLPPSFEFVDHQVSLGLNILLKRK